MRVALIDLSWVFRRHWHSQAEDSEVNTAARAAITELQRWRDGYDRCVLCLDAPPYFRSEMDPQYKAHRERPSDGFAQQARWLKSRLDADGWQMARVGTFEADDVIATLAAHYSAEGHEVYCVASDKDIAQCVDERVWMVVPRAGANEDTVLDPIAVRGKYGVEPDRMALWLALCGDKADNVPGVPGVGPKKAAQLINAHHGITGIATAMAAAAPTIKPATLKALADNWEQLRKSLELVKLRRDVPIDAAALLEQKEVRSVVKENAMPSDDEPSEAEFEPISKPPREPPEAPKPRPEPEKSTAAEQPQQAAPQTTLAKYGNVDDELQPRDLVAARCIARWAADGRLYPQFATPEAIFTIMSRGRELGLGWTTALAGFHMIEGKPSASAELIRSLVERDPNFEYMRLVSASASEATWEGKHTKHPEPTCYTYTMEEAETAGLTRPSRNGKPSNWKLRGKDMLIKTAGSKLARLLWPGPVLGLYCQEEMGDE